MLELSPLARAVASLQRGLSRWQANPEDEELRDAVIQRFEFTFELAWKFVRRQLAQELPSPRDLSLMSFQELFREAARRGLIRDPEQWFFFRYCRNLTSHTYDPAKAKEVADAAGPFLQEAQALLSELKTRNRA
ncbi:MAG: nucleotidyltransferase substrate binding protein [Thermoanaerobaculum sp.]